MNTTSRLAVMVGDLMRLVATCAQVEDLDKRATLLECAWRLLEVVRALVIEQQAAGEVAVRLLATIRSVQADHQTLARECETALRYRSRASASSGLHEVRR